MLPESTPLLVLGPTESEDRLIMESLEPRSGTQGAEQYPTPLTDAVEQRVGLTGDVLRVIYLSRQLERDRAECRMVLEMAAEVLERYEDIRDGADGRQVPNAAMSARQEINGLLDRLL